MRKAQRRRRQGRSKESSDEAELEKVTGGTHQGELLVCKFCCMFLNLLCLPFARYISRFGIPRSEKLITRCHLDGWKLQITVEGKLCLHLRYQRGVSRAAG